MYVNCYPTSRFNRKGGVAQVSHIQTTTKNKTSPTENRLFFEQDMSKKVIFFSFTEKRDFNPIY